MHVQMATSKICSLVKKIKKEVSSSSSMFGLRAKHRRKSQSLAKNLSRESLGSHTKPIQSSQHVAQLSEAYNDAPLHQHECILNLLATITATYLHSSEFSKGSTRKLEGWCWAHTKFTECSTATWGIRWHFSGSVWVYHEPVSHHNWPYFNYIPAVSGEDQQNGSKTGSFWSRRSSRPIVCYIAFTEKTFH